MSLQIPFSSAAEIRAALLRNGCVMPEAKPKAAEKAPIVHAPFPPNTLRVCNRCNKVLPLSKYYKHSRMTGGYMHRCIKCHSADINSRHLALFDDPVKRQKYLEYHRAKSKRRRDKLKAEKLAAKAGQTITAT